MNKNLFTMPLFVVLALSVSKGAIAADSKVGYVDVQKAVQATATGKKAKDVMQGEIDKRKKDLDKKKNDIEKMGQDLEKKKSVLSEEVFAKKQGELQEEMLKFQKVVAENQLEIQKKEKEVVEPILEKMKKVIEKVAQAKNYSLVLEKAGNNVLYSDKDADLTQSVIDAFEKEK